VPPNPKPNPPPPKKVEDDGGPVVGPKLEPDPVREPLEPLTDPKGTLPVPADKLNDPVRYSWVASPIVAVSSRKSKKAEGVWQVWNLRTMKQLGSVPGPIGSEVMLSADGAYLAMPVFGKGAVVSSAVKVYRVEDGQALHTFQVKWGNDSRIPVADFAGPGQFLSVQPIGADAEVKVWDVKTGDVVASFNTKGIPSRKSVCLSPGGRYLVTFESIKRLVHIYEVATGKHLRTITPKLPPASYYNSRTLVFSNDGKELALLADGDNRDRLQAWDFETGKRTADHGFGKAIMQMAQPIHFHRVELEWLPDRSGWFAYNQMLIDHDRGNIFYKIPPQDLQVPWNRRFLDRDHFATVMVTPTGQRQLEIVAAPRAEIDAARKK
jgi:WD40 repeat protein